MPEPRPLEDLFAASGVLWAINRTLFHPRGFVLALHRDQHGQVTGWTIEGNGQTVWQYDDTVLEDDYLAAFERTLTQARQL